MTTERDLDWRLAAWLDDVATASVPDTLLARSLERVGTTRQRPGWFVRAGGPVRGGVARPLGLGRPRLALAFAVVVGVLAAGAVLFAGLFSSIVPAPSDQPSQRPVTSAAPGPSATPGLRQAGGLIAYIRVVDVPNADNHCHSPEQEPTCATPRIWIVGVDGSGAHELMPGGLGVQGNVSWTPDGARLLYEDEGKFNVVGVDGAAPEAADTGCVAPCNIDMQVALSHDGDKLAFVRNRVDSSVVIATMDLASGRVAELSSTEGPVGRPRWSPDGQRIVFTVAGEKDNGGPDEPKLGAAMVVDADGQNLRQVTPATLNVDTADWSPGGARIVISASSGEARDVYTIRSDGTDLLRLTSDGVSRAASWTPDGRILFARGTPGAAGADGPALWTMDADGSNGAEIVGAQALGVPFADAFSLPAWQPTGGPAIVPPPWSPGGGIPVGPPEPTAPATPLPDLAPGFSWTGSMNLVSEGFGGAIATLLTDGRVLIIHACLPTAELYDPGTGTFTATGALAAARIGEAATLLPDGRVLVTGGGSCDDANPGTWATAEVYDPTSGSFSGVGSMSRPRQGHTATLLPDGRVLVAGGTTGAAAVAAGGIQLASVRSVATYPDVLATAELYDPATGTFSRTGSMTTERVNHTATQLADGRVLVVGAGDSNFGNLPSAEVYDPATGAFHGTGSMAVGRYSHTATLLLDGRVLVAGGKNGESNSLDSAELYDPATGRFSSAGSMHDARAGYTATRLLDGRVLIAGGWDNEGQSWQVLSAAELYDAGAGTFTVIGSIGEPRTDQTATLLADGRVLIAGGTDIDNSGGVNLTSAVLYRP
jgi:hypothetical protein